MKGVRGRDARVERENEGRVVDVVRHISRIH